MPIKYATADGTINWTLTSDWHNFNGHSDVTSDSHSKDLAWKIKTSTKSLPTLDILNHNYPN